MGRWGSIILSFTPPTSLARVGPQAFEILWAFGQGWSWKLRELNYFEFYTPHYIGQSRPSGFWDIVSVWAGLKLKVAFQPCVFMLFFFFALQLTVKLLCREKNTIRVLFIHCSRTVYGSHDTIHTFKNYFVTVFSVFSLNNNKLNPNKPNIWGQGGVSLLGTS